MADKERTFKYTRGRFLFDEERKLAERYVRFDVDALGRIGAKAVGANSCTKIEKHHEGTCNKILLLTMDNDAQVIAKIRTPNAGPAHETVSSEVATMDFVRDVLKQPVPKVHDWSSNATESEIGAEYIIMEKCCGVQLKDAWSKMNVQQRTRVLISLAQMHSTWASIAFTKYGSLSFAKDSDATPTEPLYVDQSGTSITNSKYTIGPSTGRRNFDNLKSTVEFNRGPWESAEDHLRGLGQREMDCVNKAPRFPVSQKSLFGPKTYIPTREKKLRAINCYLDLIKYLLPQSSFTTSCLWHPDAEGIFVDPGTGEITGLVDWQAAEVATLFTQASEPDMSDYEGGSVPGAESPDVPGFAAQHGQAALSMGQSFFQQMIQGMLSRVYKTGIKGMCPNLEQVLEYRGTQGAGLLILGSSMFIDAEPMYMNAVVGMKDTWARDIANGRHPTAPYPFNFSEEEKRSIETDSTDWNRAGETLQRMGPVLSQIPVEAGFMVPPPRYEEAKQLTRLFKQKFKEAAYMTEAETREFDKWWPFDD